MGKREALDDAAPDLQQLLLGVLLAVENAVEGDRHRLGQHELLARVLQDCPARGLALQHQAAQARLLGGEGRGQARRPGAHDEQVEAIRRRPRLARHVLDGLDALGHRVADQRIAAQLAGHVDPRQVRLQMRIVLGDVVARAEVAQPDADTLDRTGHRAEAVAHALEPVDDDGLARHQTQHLPLGTGGDTGAAADAAQRVDLGVLGDGAIGPQRYRFRAPGGRLALAAAEAARVGQHDGQHEQEGAAPDGKGLHARSAVPVRRRSAGR